jgi:hypothetical protein
MRLMLAKIDIIKSQYLQKQITAKVNIQIGRSQSQPKSMSVKVIAAKVNAVQNNGQSKYMSTKVSVTCI